MVEEEIANDFEEKEEVLTYNEPKQEDKKQEQAKKKQKRNDYCRWGVSYPAIR